MSNLLKKFATRDIVSLDNKRLIDEAWKVFSDSSSSEKRTLKLETVATHSGKIINKRMYPGAHVKTGATSLYKNEAGAAFGKPFLKNHDSHSEPIGRIVSAEYKHILHDAEWNTDFMNPSKQGSGFLQVTSHINDADAIEKFLDGRYSTVSISGDTNAAHCSVCSKQNGKMVDYKSVFEDTEGSEHQCDHTMGQVYEIDDNRSEKAYLITGELFYDEISQVNMPADDTAVHVSKELMIADSVNGNPSILKDIDLGSSVNTLISVPRFAILDAQGNEINGLTTDTYKSTKTISLPSSPSGKKVEDSKEDKSSDKGISEESFAKALVLDHFSKAGYLEVTDEETEEVNKLSKATLTETQKKILDERGLFVNVHLPFKLFDKSFVKAYWEVADRLTLFKDNESKSSFMKAVERQALTEKIDLQDSVQQSNKGESVLTKEQEEALTKELSDSKAKIETLETAISDSAEKFKELQGTIVADKAAKVVDLRKKLGFHDAVEADADALKLLVLDYAKKDLSVIEFLIEDLSTQLDKKGAFEDEETLTPVEDPTKVADDKKKTEETKAIDDKKSDEASSVLHLTDSM